MFHLHIAVMQYHAGMFHLHMAVMQYHVGMFLLHAEVLYVHEAVMQLYRESISLRGMMTLSYGTALLLSFSIYPGILRCAQDKKTSDRLSQPEVSAFTSLRRKEG